MYHATVVGISLFCWYRETVKLFNSNKSVICGGSREQIPTFGDFFTWRKGKLHLWIANISILAASERAIVSERRPHHDGGDVVVGVHLLLAGSLLLDYGQDACLGAVGPFAASIALVAPPERLERQRDKHPAHRLAEPVVGRAGGSVTWPETVRRQVFGVHGVHDVTSGRSRWSLTIDAGDATRTMQIRQQMTASSSCNGRVDVGGPMCQRRAGRDSTRRHCVCSTSPFRRSPTV